MGVVLHNPAAYFKVLGGIAPQVVVDTDVSSSAIPTQETNEDLMLVIHCGTCSDGAFKVQLLHDNATDGSFEEVLYESEEFNDENSGKIVIASIANFKPYVKVVVKALDADAEEGMPISVVVLGVDRYI